MYNTNITQVIAFIRSKPRKYWIIRIGIILAGIWILYTVFTFTLVRVIVQYHDGIKEQAIIVSTADGRHAEKAFSIGDFTFLKRDTDAITLLAETYQTDKAIDPLPFIGIQEIKVNIYKDKDVRKYSGDNIGCTAYDKQTDTILSYNCGKPANLVRYDRPLTGAQWQNTIIGEMNNGQSPINSVKPFQNGLLGLSVDIEPRQPFRPLFYIDSSGKKLQINMPDNIDFSQWDEVSIVTDQTSTDSNRFLLIHNKGAIYLGQFDGVNATYQQINPPNDFNNLFDTLSCRLLETTIYCYYGQKGHIHQDSEAEIEHTKKNPGGTIFVSGPSGTKQYKINDDKGVDDFFMTRSKHLYALRDRKSMYRIELKDERAEFRLLSQGVQSVGGGDGVIYIKGNSLFKIDDVTQESYLIFQSNHLRLSNVVIFGDDIFVNGYINDTLPEKLHTYKVSTQSSPLSQGERLVDKLPFYIPNILLDMDYADNIIRIRVNANVTVEKNRDLLSFNIDDYERNREEILNKLSEKGISSEDYNIIFSR